MEIREHLIKEVGPVVVILLLEKHHHCLCDLVLQDCEQKLALKRKYEGNHFDSVIKDYKEIELPFQKWSQPNQEIIARLIQTAIETSGLQRETSFLPPHVIELKESTGEILPHVDSKDFGGKIVASLSLHSARTLKITPPPTNYIEEDDKKFAESASALSKIFEFEVPPRSFYILKDFARYHLAHAISSGSQKRISIILRDEPELPEWMKL